MKCVFKKGKPVIDLSAADLAVLTKAIAICDFVRKNTPDGELRECSASGSVSVAMVHASFAPAPVDEPEAVGAA